MTEHLISLDFVEPLSEHRTRHAEALLEGRFIGAKSPVSGKVFFPSKGYDAMSRVRMGIADEVELRFTETVVSYTGITPVQCYGQEETEPYIWASVLLDGSDTLLGQQDIKDLPIDEFRSGLRVRATVRPKEQRSVEPGVPCEEYREHVF